MNYPVMNKGLECLPGSLGDREGLRSRLDELQSEAGSMEASEIARVILL